MSLLFTKLFQGSDLQFTKLEFWAITTIFIFAVFNQVIFTPGSETKLVMSSFYEGGSTVNSFIQILRYTLLYLGFVLFSYTVLPRITKKGNFLLPFILLLVSYLLIGVLLEMAGASLYFYQPDRQQTGASQYGLFFASSFLCTLYLLLIFVLFTGSRLAVLALVYHLDAIHAKYRNITRDVLKAFVVWLVGIVLLWIIREERDWELILLWGISGLTGIVVYYYSFHSLFRSSQIGNKSFLSYVISMVPILGILLIPVGVIGIFLVKDAMIAIEFSFINLFFQLLITIPLSWVLVKRQLREKEKLSMLEKELGDTHANLDFLRSQINPHFLFNTLNTIYATALLENSERTAQGIQMLGDMMRFMIHENLQQKIMLSRETAYICNYIELQLLRISFSKGTVVQTEIGEVKNNQLIAPMLLLPLVENAFKHGIGLKNNSWIKIRLWQEEDTLHLKVHNSLHAKQEQETEMGKSGIGLENLKQRLALLYPAHHELQIQRDEDSFLAYLMLRL